MNYVPRIIFFCKFTCLFNPINKRSSYKLITSINGFLDAFSTHSFVFSVCLTPLVKYL